EIERRQYDSLELISQSSAYEYLYPEYDITIHRAYKDFYYTFSVLVGPDGKLRLGKFFVMPEFEESRRRVLTGIVDVYLQHLLDVTPATTLGLPHNSVVYLRVRGRAGTGEQTKNAGIRSLNKQDSRGLQRKDT